MDKIPIIIVAVVVVIAALIFVSMKPEPIPMPAGIVLFYGEECPHCKIVEDFIIQNKIDEKMKITRLESWHNKSNAQLLLNAAVLCKVDVTQGVPVPLLWDGKTCYVGDVDSIKFLRNEAGIE